MTVKATAKPALNSNKPLIKKLIGLIVVVAVCVTVIVIVVKVLGSGSSDDDKKEKVKFDGKSNKLNKKKKQTNKRANFRTKHVSKSGSNFFVYFFFLTIFFLSLQSVY